jgi:hypothetical protein
MVQQAIQPQTLVPDQVIRYINLLLVLDQLNFRIKDMKYMKGEVFPYTESDLHKDYPNTSFTPNPLTNPSIRDSYGIVEVQEVEKPTQRSYKAVSGTPAGDPLSETWTLVPKEIHELDRDDIVPTLKVPFPDGQKPKYVEGSNDTTEDPVWVEGDPYGYWKEVWAYEDVTDWREARLQAYGGALDQLEFITENGLTPWQTKVAEIKAKYPKP